MSRLMSSSKRPRTKIPTVLVLLVPIFLALVLLCVSLSRIDTGDFYTRPAADFAAVTINTTETKQEEKTTPSVDAKTRSISASDSQIPPCEKSPWKQSENLVGSCRPVPGRSDLILRQTRSNNAPLTAAHPKSA
mmetsp:Transcript_8040/g.17371  ORF Transcript_8040/g.17371 Transcript_8040/m.17371 type:complete len:134 (+) Transcript_8040:263-664(+)